MSTLYLFRYRGPERYGGIAGAGTLYISNGLIIGVDCAGVRHEGTYVIDHAGRMQASVILHVPAGVKLATGVTATRPTQIAMSFDLPRNFADGTAYLVQIQGKSVYAEFTVLTCENMGPRRPAPDAR